MVRVRFKFSIMIRVSVTVRVRFRFTARVSIRVKVIVRVRFRVRDGVALGGEGEFGRESTLRLGSRGLDLRPWQITEDSVSLPVKGNTDSKLTALS